MDNFKFFAHKECEYYPCHKGIDEMNCLFCYCPLYLTDCPGNPSFIVSGSETIKDCSNCLFPHVKSNYDKIISLLQAHE